MLVTTHAPPSTTHRRSSMASTAAVAQLDATENGADVALRAHREALHAARGALCLAASKRADLLQVHIDFVSASAGRCGVVSFVRSTVSF